MSLAHSGVSFNHSCLKVPVDPRSQRPAPNYERHSPHKLIENNSRNDEYNRHYTRDKVEPLASPTSSMGNFKSVESYLQFYENIPDYSELHHLSDDEFYSRLKSLKIAQKRFCNASDIDGNDLDLTYAPRERPSSYSSFSSRDKCNQRIKNRKNKLPEYKKEAEPLPVSNCSSLYSSPSKNRITMDENVEIRKNFAAEKSRSHSEIEPTYSDHHLKPDNSRPSRLDYLRNSVLHNSPKIKPPPPKITVISDSENISDMGYDEKIAMEGSDKLDTYDCKRNSDESSMMNIWDKASVNEFMSKEDEIDYGSLSDDGVGGYGRKSRSLPSSPGCKSKFCGCGCGCDTPKICRRMLHVSMREKDEHVDPMEFHVHGIGGRSDKEPGVPGKKKKSHAHPVPLLSRIPLFDKIMAEQEARRRLIHYRYSKELQALVQPFSFTKREEEERQRIRSSCSNPDLSASSRPQTPFKARPVPKNLFSNYAYERMREDEFYRALKKRIRAQEMLKSASLPPSMAARERKFRSKSLDFLDYKHSKKKRNKTRGYKRACEVLRREMQVSDNDKNTNSPKRKSRSAWLSSGSSRRRHSMTDSSTEVSPYESISEPERRNKGRPHSALSINRNNLASVLRIQTVRKRMEREIQENLEENRLKEEAKFKARLVRMTPAWRALNYSTEEDLALRVAARREEERLRREHHQKLMGSIYGRVHNMPPLFQRQTSPIGPKYSGVIKKRPHDEKENKNKINYKDLYFENHEGNPKERGKDNSTEKKSKRFSMSAGASPTRNHDGFESRASTESIASQDKSEGMKGESGSDMDSHDDDIDDYEEGQGDGEEN